MDKTKYVIIGLCVLISLLLVLPFLFLRRGTFSLDTAERFGLVLSCPSETTKGAQIDCEIKLQNAGDKILGFKANYQLDNLISYKNFTSSITCEENDDSCVNVSTNNGFLVADIDGLDKNLTFGKVKLNVSNDVVENKNYTIKLTGMEISDNGHNIISLEDVSASVKIKATETPPAGDITFKDLNVDNTDKIIKRIKQGTKYSELKAKITPNNSIKIISNDGNSITDNDIIKTGDMIEITSSSGKTIYTLSVLGDLTGDGIIELNDVSKLYRHQRKRKIIEDKATLLAGDIVENGEIIINDVGRLYRFRRGRVDTLEVVE